MGFGQHTTLDSAAPHYELMWGDESTRALAEATPQGVISVTREGVIAWANSATQCLFGYSRDELIGQPLECLIPERARDRHRRHWALYAADPYVRPMGTGMTLNALRKDGSEFPTEIGLGCVEIGGQRLFVAFIADVTVRQNVVDALHKTEEDLRRYMESAPAAIATFDLEMRYLAVSQRYRDDYRLGSRDILGLSHYEVFPEIRDNWREVHKRCLKGAVERCNAEPFLRADGSTQWIRWEIQPWRRADGSIGGIILISEDITRQKEAEAEVLRLNASLEQRVRERTSELESANRELHAFSYSVSHDLRAPVRRIDGWSMALLEDYGARLDARAKTYLARLRDEAAHLESLIDGMLRLSRVSSAEMLRESVDLSSLVSAICGRFRENTPGRQLEFVIAPDLTVCGDANLLEIAVTNLLSNAVKFTAPRMVARIDFGRQGGAGSPFFVRDNGVGFDMAYAGNLFAAFERLHKASQFAGTGIGLATVQRVIHRHGGRVWAEAQPDKGATFYFTIGGSD